MTQMLIDTFGYMSPMYIAIILAIGLAFFQIIIWAIPQRCFDRIGIPKWVFYTCNVLVTLFVATIASTQGGDCDPFATLGTFGKEFMTAIKAGNAGGEKGFSKELFEWFIGASVFLWSMKAVLEVFSMKKTANTLNVIGVGFILINTFCIYNNVNLKVFSDAILIALPTALGV